jgi:hypothetical protein
MAYIGTKPANQVIDSTLIADGTVTTSDIASGVTINFADGSASTPSITNDGDTNTGMFFPAADTIAFAEGGTEVMRIASTGNVGIGTSTPNANSGTSLVVYDASTPRFRLTNSTTGQTASDGAELSLFGSDFYIENREAANMVFYNNGAERMRIDSTGRLLVGTTSTSAVARIVIQKASGSADGLVINQDTGGSGITQGSSGSTGLFAYYFTTSGVCGTISGSGTSTTYATSSDYRLKENVVPMTGALATVAQLKPVTYTWKHDGSASQGFIAHELQEVVPDAVVGEKDAVNEDGTIKAKRIDTSLLVATLTAAIQEQQAIITDLKARIETLEAK